MVDKLILIFGMLFIVNYLYNFVRIGMCMCGSHVNGFGALVSFLPIGLSDYVMNKYYEKKYEGRGGKYE
jgi:hypothetical protein